MSVISLLWWIPLKWIWTRYVDNNIVTRMASKTLNWFDLLGIFNQIKLFLSMFSLMILHLISVSGFSFLLCGDKKFHLVVYFGIVYFERRIAQLIKLFEVFLVKLEVWSWHFFHCKFILWKQIEWNFFLHKSPKKVIQNIIRQDVKT